MENETFIPDDYADLLNQYLLLKKEVNEVKQNLYETSRQLKLNEALLIEYQNDNELLQNREQLQNEKVKTKIASLEEIIANLRSTHSNDISHLEAELEQKEQENNDLKSRLDIFQRKNSVEATDVSTSLNEIIALTNDNEVLQEKLHEMEKAFEYIQTENCTMKKTLEEYKEELGEVKESLNLKREELSENATLIDKLNDELICALRELENYKQKPLESDSKGNSLFAEVDDRRVYLQETINQMKSSYVHLQQEHSQHVKLISQLRRENADLRESWKKDLEEIQDDKYWVNNTLQRRVEVLEELLEEQKKELEERSMIAGSDLSRDFVFYHQMINNKSKEINQWKKKYSDKSINEHLLSVNLAQSNKKVRLLKLELQQKLEELNDTRETIKNDVLCHKCSAKKEDQRKSRPFKFDEVQETHGTQDRIPLKSCLKQETTPENDLTLVFNSGAVKDESSYKIFNSDVTPYAITHRRKVQSVDVNNITDDFKENMTISVSPNTTEDSTSFVDKENISSNIINTTNDKEERKENIPEENAQEKRGVTFSENTVDSVGNAGRRRGTRVFIMKKKNDVS